MSRFSKAEAEALGWLFAHDKPEEREIVGGMVKIIPASVRAEKMLPNGQLINEEAESIGLLLERIHGYEAFQAKLEAPAPTEPEDALLDADGMPLRSVGTSEGRMTEDEFRARESADAIAADAAAQQFAREEEDARFSTPQEFANEQPVVEEAPEAEKEAQDEPASEDAED